MDNSAVQIIGAALGQHGPYTFYKAFKYDKNKIKHIVKLGDFFFVKLWSDSDLVCIGELLLLWYDKNSEQVLTSLRLYFLPENTPEGRIEHGEDEVLAISEKVVLRLEDLVTWITLDAAWTWGQLAPFSSNEDGSPENEKAIIRLADRALDFKDVDKEKELLGQEQEDKSSGPTVIILSFPGYCRYRAAMKRVEGVEDLKTQIMAAKTLGGVSASNSNTWVLFCRDTFDYPELEGHELLCNHLAPKLKGRPRGRRKKRSLSPGSESNESECSVSNAYNTAQARLMTEENSNEVSTSGMSTRRSSRLVVSNNESKEFLKKLTTFMQLNETPMGRIPSLGYKELDLYAFFTRVDKLGGYESVTKNRLWKSIFDDLSGNYISTSAATVIRRHYERFLLPYELYLKGEEFNPSILKTTIKRTKIYSSSFSEADINDNTNSSNVVITSNSTILPTEGSTSSQINSFPLPTNTDNQTKEHEIKIKTETKTSTLRSIRVKPDRSKDFSQKTEMEPKDDLPQIKSEYLLSNKSQIIPSGGLSVELITSLSAVKTEDSPSTEISPSKPPEGKENIATCNTSISAVIISKNIDINHVEVPYTSKTPEPQIIKTNCVSSSLLSSVKKRKLDILKEGGLEVTPVKQSLMEDKHVKENRSSVIRQTMVPKTTIGQLSITLTTDKPTEKLVSKSNTNSFLYGKDVSPPKIPQSSSIYAHSERTVYGNPKDYFMPPAPHTPRLINNLKHTGGEILDLTIKSPQKPLGDTGLPAELSKRVFKSNLEMHSRVGSNLEITLVAPNTSKVNTKHQSQLSSKRSLPNNTMTQQRKQHQNGTKLPYGVAPGMSIPQAYAPRERHHLSSSYNGKTTPKPQVSPNLKSYANTPPAAVPNFYSQLSLANKMMPPYVPPIDPLYLSAIQSLYPHGQPFIPMPTPEQLQFYTELMARNSQIPRFPFPYSQDTKNSLPVKNVSPETLKK